MKQIFLALADCLLTEAAVLVTVVAGSGSTPRGAGAAMVVSSRGRLAGTIGGGMVEYRAEQLAQELLQKQEHQLVEFRLTQDQVLDLGMICGGEVTVYFRFIPAQDAPVLALLTEALACFQQNENSWWLLDTKRGDFGLYRKSRGGQSLSLTDRQKIQLLRSRAVQFDGLYAQPLYQVGRVIVFGGGHVAQELIPVLDHLGFDCLVFDDRPDFVSPELFPSAKERILGDFAQIADYVTLHPEDYAVVMTRGHAFDLSVQRQLHFRQLAYLGVIGSRSKMAKIFQLLREEGVPQAELDRVHTPIGLAIRAETPAEIAISIAAELILVRAERNNGQ